VVVWEETIIKGPGKKSLEKKSEKFPNQDPQAGGEETRKIMSKKKRDGIMGGGGTAGEPNRAMGQEKRKAEKMP